MLACRRPSGFRAHATQLRRLGEDHPVWLAGRGATPRVLEEVQVRNLGGDLVAAVAELSATARARRSARPVTDDPGGDDADPRGDAGRRPEGGRPRDGSQPGSGARPGAEPSSA